MKTTHEVKEARSKQNVTFPDAGLDGQPSVCGSSEVLVVGQECLTTVDRYRTFVACVASDRRMRVFLSFGETWETAWPVAWESAGSPGRR